VRPPHRDTLAAVSHADGSARVQTVAREHHARFHRLLEALAPRIGVPVALNTSFNVSGEPIVASPTDAVRTFFASGLDALVIGSFGVTK
jgi:carbamoyltransferase